MWQLGSLRFAYSESEVTNAFNDSARFGGPIHEGEWVRICFVGRRIVRLEIAAGDPPPS